MGSTFIYIYHLICIDLESSRLLNSPTLHRYIKSLSTYSVSFSLLCVVIKYRKDLPKKVSWISITYTNLVCAFLRLV
jgi:hypothetical protein